ncbi:pectate lyase superfamily protein-domain-containing protein [Zopfochytrium polystomum]|nr:pectate lyase superfamily protein-domain-containing protein [Zopfochytrium polystomum]
MARTYRCGSRAALRALALSVLAVFPIACVNAAVSSNYWFANIARQGSVAYTTSNPAGYTVVRNVLDYGAKGDGVTDDTAAINSAISAGNRCGQGCDSSTTTPAIVYFPAGTYLVSSPLNQYYYTMMIGDPTNLPVLKAAASFSGMAVIDADPYVSGVNWFTNQNNFFRQIRNFVIDLTGLPASTGTGIHWQVAQATSLQNIVFKMVQGGSGNAQQGIFMDNGSGGFFTDLVFIGGKYGMFIGSQQFTSRNLTFTNCQTAIYLNWDWGWTFKSVNVTGCTTGLDMTSSGSSGQQVGSAVLLDSTFTNTGTAINTAFSSSSTPTGAGALIIDNTNFVNTPVAVSQSGTTTLLAGNQLVTMWGQGRKYVGSAGSRVQGSLTGPSKPSVLLNAQGKVYERSKPQYADVPVSKFVSLKSKGAKGDGTTDDTAAIQAALNGLASDQILYIDHGAYVVTSTVTVPKNARIVGELWPLIMASGNAFKDYANPTPVFKVGNAGDVGNVEISDVIFETVGSLPGAILMQWNVNSSSQGGAGLWDVHFRVGGSSGTGLQSDTCLKNP